MKQALLLLLLTSFLAGCHTPKPGEISKMDNRGYGGVGGAGGSGSSGGPGSAGGLGGAGGSR
ncbi:Lipoprotein [Legionella anisa]|uniref:hypothetical protein n=1 Tax=Legionella anisa TaxID=28082 RepID=UPI000349E63A|nr:hypothetical protein [Legionella anisa]KTC71440.1 hypothetical protein Lani_1788 [Legionella anisa]MBN5935183.1 hypothetical protein [Legionella anisa]MCW8425815.1 hypothetical protein [Legionella anisa]MCW8448754.1 hypothetical protein [Legionella anisa]UAK79318.1 hypothetical protein K8O89_17075 [Legionella anisa]